MTRSAPLPAAAPISAGSMADLWRTNRRRLAGDHQRARVVTEGRPAHLKLELTNYCNLRCPMCPHEKMRRPVGYMDPAMLRRILDMAAPELEFAYLHHLGESLFHPRIGELIREGKDRGVALGLSTNATFLDDRKARVLLDSGLDFLVVSMDAASHDTYERMRAGGDFATTLRNARRFLELRRAAQSDMAVVVQLIATPANQHEITAFAALWRDEDGAQVMIKQARDWAGQVDLLPLRRAPHPPAQALAPEAPPPLQVACRMLWSELTVLWDGAVVPCANVYEKDNVVGDLATQTLDEVWNGPAMRALREAHAGGDVRHVPVCNTCPRHAFDHHDFVARGQLEQRIEHYTRDDLTPRPGLS